jgi:hypothetical protein
MRLNKKCPHYEDCKTENERLTEMWEYDCPKFIRGKDPRFYECMRYEELERASVRINNGPP